METILNNIYRLILLGEAQRLGLIKERTVRQMPHSLRVKLKRLNSKGLLRDTDTDRLIKALDTVDGLQDAIAEIWDKIDDGSHADEYLSGYYDGLVEALYIIKKHTGVEV